jgi:hypothetical protein
MPVPVANGYCLGNQQEEDDCTLKNSVYASYLCQGNLQDLRSSWAARNCLISEFLLYLTDYQGERSLIENLQLQDTGFRHRSPQTFRLALSMVIHRYCNVPGHLFIMLSNSLMILRMFVRWVGDSVVMNCAIWNVLTSCLCEQCLQTWRVVCQCACACVCVCMCAECEMWLRKYQIQCLL